MNRLVPRLVVLAFFLTAPAPALADVSLDPAHWTQVEKRNPAVQPVAVPDGLKVPGSDWTQGQPKNGILDGNAVMNRTQGNYIGQTIVEFTVDGGGRYMSLHLGPKALQFLKPFSTGNSWQGSKVLPQKVRLTMRLDVSEDGTVKQVVTQTANGAIVSSQTGKGSSLTPKLLRKARFHVNFVDNKAGRGAFVTLHRIVTPFSGAPVAAAKAPTPSEDVGSSLPTYEPFADEVKLLETIKLDPSPVHRQALASLRRKYAVALSAMADGDTKSAAFQRAALYAESAAKLDPKNIQGWMIYGTTLLAVPDWPLTQPIAEEVFRIALGLDPKNADAGVYLGQALFNQQRYDAARAQWSHVYRLHPKAATPERMGPLNMAIILSGEIEEGIGLFRDLNATDRWPHWMLAQGLLTKHMMDTTRDPHWKTEFAAIDAFLTKDVGEEAQYWSDMKAKWKAGGAK